jgi:hypothetical protein
MKRFIVTSFIATKAIVGAIAALTLGLPQAQAGTQHVLRMYQGQIPHQLKLEKS